MLEAGYEPVEIKHEPREEELQGAEIVMIADFDKETTARIYQKAKAVGALVNAEDRREFCDFHVPAIVRRGDLLLTVSTGGKSPRLARRLRQWLEGAFRPEWKERLEYIAYLRNEWRVDGIRFSELAEKTDELLKNKGWLEELDIKTYQQEKM